MDVDTKGRAKPSSIANALQDAAREHADVLGWGVETLKTRMKYWVLSRIRVELDVWPGYGQHVEIETWPKGTSGRFALRDFVMRMDGVEVGKVTSSWALLDAKTGRPLSVDDLAEEFMLLKDRHALENPAQKVESGSEPVRQQTLTPMYHDLDIVGHVNNARYLDWAWSAVSPEIRRGVQGWTVNYNREVRDGGEVRLSTYERGDHTVVSGDLEGDKRAFAVSFIHRQ